MKYFKTYEAFKKSYMSKMDLKDFKKIKKGSKILYMGGQVKVLKNDGYVLTLKGQDGKTFKVNKGMFDHGGQINEHMGKYNTLQKVIRVLGRRPSEEEVANFINNNFKDVTGETDKSSIEQSDNVADIIGFYKFDIDDWLDAWNNTQNESVSEGIVDDLVAMGAQIDYLYDADSKTQKIWKKAGFDPNDQDNIILYSYVNSWPETKKMLDKKRVKYKELEDPNSAGESYIVFKESIQLDENRSHPSTQFFKGARANDGDLFHSKRHGLAVKKGDKLYLFYAWEGEPRLGKVYKTDKLHNHLGPATPKLIKTYYGDSEKEMADYANNIQESEQLNEGIDFQAILLKDAMLKYNIKPTGGIPRTLQFADKGYMKAPKGTFLIGLPGGLFAVNMKKKFAVQLTSGSRAYLDAQDKLKDSDVGGTNMAPEFSQWKQYLNESMNELNTDGAIMDLWKKLYGEDFISEYPAVAKILKVNRKNIDRRELARIWDETYGEDLKDKYPDFFKALK